MVSVKPEDPDDPPPPAKVKKVTKEKVTKEKSRAGQTFTFGGPSNESAGERRTREKENRKKWEDLIIPARDENAPVKGVKKGTYLKKKSTRSGVPSTVPPPSSQRLPAPTPSSSRREIEEKEPPAKRQKTGSKKIRKTRTRPFAIAAM